MRGCLKHEGWEEDNLNPIPLVVFSAFLILQPLGRRLSSSQPSCLRQPLISSFSSSLYISFTMCCSALLLHMKLLPSGAMICTFGAAPGAVADAFNLQPSGTVVSAFALPPPYFSIRIFFRPMSTNSFKRSMSCDV